MILNTCKGSIKTICDITHYTFILYILQKYFQEFEYMQSPNDDPNSPSAQLKAQDVEEAIRVFERRWNLTETGKAEGETLRYLRMSRCGNVDKLNPESKKRRKKRYELQGKKRGP